MAAYNFDKNRALAQRLLQALGLGGKRVKKLVIEIACDSLVKVYVTAESAPEELAKVCEAFEVIPVSDVEVCDPCVFVQDRPKRP